MSKSDAAITDAVSGITIIEVVGPSEGNQPNNHHHSILSDQTITALDTRPKPGKRARIEDPPQVGDNQVQDIRDRYPVETKPIYLASKNMYRRKLRLAIAP